MKVLFPITNRVHLARQKLLIDELEKRDIEVIKFEQQLLGDTVSERVSNLIKEICVWLKYNSVDLLLARGDRYEILPIVMICAYNNIPIAHIEGGDLSGAIDNKVRFAISSLADLHFVTNWDSYWNLASQKNINFRSIYNYGSLDAENAARLEDHGKYKNKKYSVFLYHPILGEDPEIIYEILQQEFEGEIIRIKSNSDNGKPYGEKEYSSEEYLELIKYAKILVGNSSSFIKEASIYGTPVVLVGDRQKNRLKPPNTIEVKFNETEIRDAIRNQLTKSYQPSTVYFQPHTSKKIADKIKEYLHEQ